MNIKKILLTLSIYSMAVFFTACSDPSEELNTLVVNKESQFQYLKGLESREYYVLHKDNTYEKTYFGEATFSKGDANASPKDDRIMWFRGDEKKIPVLYKGEQIICYNPEEISEKQTFERFYPYGYTVGLCQLEATSSGRMALSTAKDDKNTYPYADTDALLNSHNDTVIIDKMGDEPLRQLYFKNDNGGNSKKVDWEHSRISKIGTINGLQKDKTYNFDIYDGTIKKHYKFTADVFALGSFEGYENYNYEFLYDNVIAISIPEWFNSGYYIINGKGMFKYINGETDNESISLVAENVKPELDEGSFSSSKTVINKTAEKVASSGEDNKDKPKSSFKVEQGGLINIKVTFEGEGEEDSKVGATLRTPSGNYYEMDQKQDGSVALEYDAKEVGTYVIEYYKLGNRIPTLEVVPGASKEIESEANGMEASEDDNYDFEDLDEEYYEHEY